MLEASALTAPSETSTGPKEKNVARAVHQQFVRIHGVCRNQTHGHVGVHRHGADRLPVLKHDAAANDDSFNCVSL
jgi:hypothetical protein